MGLGSHVAAVLFGSTSWLCVNAVWMELSLMMKDFGNSLPSYLDVVVQVACAFVLIVASTTQRFSSISITHPFWLIFVLLVFAAVAQFALAFTWKVVTPLFGAPHPLALFALMFVLSCVSASSNFLFLPYMAKFHVTHLTAYFVGMGLSSLLPALISLAQGTLNYKCVNNGTELIPIFEKARFSESTYFLLIVAWLLVGIIAFNAMEFRWFYDEESASCDVDTSVENVLRSSSISANSRIEEDLTGDVSRDALSLVETHSGTFSYRFWALLACLVVTSAEMNSIVMSIQIFSTLSYSVFTYHMALTLSAASQSVFCLLPLWVRPKSLGMIVTLTVLSTTICAYIIALALCSPTPPLQHHFMGAVLAVAASVISFALNSYLRTLITSMISEEATLDLDGTNDKDRLQNAAKSRLFWCGAIMQVRRSALLLCSHWLNFIYSIYLRFVNNNLITLDSKSLRIS